MDEDVVVWWLLQWLSQVLTPEFVIGVVLALLLVVAVVAVLIAVTFVRYRRHPNVRRAILRLRAEHLASDLEAEVIDLRLDLRDELGDARRAVASVRAVEREVAWVQSGMDAMGELMAPAPPGAERRSIAGGRERAERPRRR